MRQPLLILGASARAAAQAAARAGFRPFCGDLFADADLPDCAVGQVARRFPGDLPRIAEAAPPGPWMYTGGLENHPTVVARISKDRELLGTSPADLRSVRDPDELVRVLQSAGLPVPESRATSEGLSTDGAWLRKHRRSSGGLRVNAWRGPIADRAGRGWYYQRRIDGASLSAVYLAAAGDAKMLGATEQILSGSGDLPFQYAGSLGPLVLPLRQQRSITALGKLLAKEFALRGLFGVDLIVAGGDVWTIEVNPRYTASVEILERTLGFNAVSLHLAACREGRLPDVQIRDAPDYCGKLILYAERQETITAELTAALLERNRDLAWPAVADIPQPGTKIRRGQPVLTVLADGGDRALAAAEARRQLCDLHETLDL